jgi:hypothetical protein
MSQIYHWGAIKIHKARMCVLSNMAFRMHRQYLFISQCLKNLECTIDNNVFLKQYLELLILMIANTKK